MIKIISVEMSNDFYYISSIYKEKDSAVLYTIVPIKKDKQDKDSYDRLNESIDVLLEIIRLRDYHNFEIVDIKDSIVYSSNNDGITTNTIVHTYILSNISPR